MKRVMSAAAAIILFGSAVMAQQAVGAGTSAARNRGAETPTLAPPAHMSGQLLQVDMERNAVQVRMKRNNREVDAGFALDSQCRIKADKKQFGKGQLELAELKAGYLVEMTVRPSDMVIIEMKVKLPRESHPRQALTLKKLLRPCRGAFDSSACSGGRAACAACPRLFSERPSRAREV